MAPEDIPVLFFKGSLPLGGEPYSKKDRRDGFFIAGFSDDELEEIEDVAREGVRSEIMKIWKNSGVKYDSEHVAEIFDAIHEQWRQLDLFQELKSNRIYKIPIETAMREISKDDFEKEKKLAGLETA